jgi:hypothetical protein
LIISTWNARATEHLPPRLALGSHLRTARPNVRYIAQRTDGPARIGACKGKSDGGCLVYLPFGKNSAHDRLDLQSAITVVQARRRTPLLPNNARAGGPLAPPCPGRYRKRSLSQAQEAQYHRDYDNHADKPKYVVHRSSAPVVVHYQRRRSQSEAIKIRPATRHGLRDFVI